MLSPEVFAAFALTATLLTLAPGPDNIFVLAHAAVYGPRAGIVLSLGLCSGLLIHSALVAAGLAALVSGSANAILLIRVGGAAYLLYLAWQCYRNAGAGDTGDAGEAFHPARLYLRGVLMNLVNPKVLLFFLALLPQFADPTRGPVGTQILALGGVFFLCAFGVFSSLSFFAGSIQRVFRRRQGLRKGADYAMALLFCVLAATVLLSEAAST